MKGKLQLILSIQALLCMAVHFQEAIEMPFKQM